MKKTEKALLKALAEMDRRHREMNQRAMIRLAMQISGK